MDGAFRGRLREMCMIERGSCQNTVGYPLSPPSVLGHNCKYVSLHAVVHIVSPLKAAFLQETNCQRSINSLYRYSFALFTLFLKAIARLLFTDCAGCGRDIKNGQALLALDRQWHLGCFKCKACSKVLTGEYISK